jgi:hypothetical protein
MSDTSSLVEVHSDRRFSQEIFEIIIDQLRGDNATLIQCALVCQSFYPSSHRNIYFSVDLDTTGKVERLHRVLNAFPNLRQDIQELAITLAARQEWFTGNTVLADIFGMLPGLKALLWRTWECTSWNKLSSELRTALVTQFRSTSLTTIAIKAVHDFPLTILNVAPAVKKLELSFIRLLEGDRQLIMLPHLEMLIIQTHFGTATGVKLIIPNLRQLSFTDCDDELCYDLVQKAINAAAGSLQRIRWDYNLRRGMWTPPSRLKNSSTFNSPSRSHQLERTSLLASLDVQCQICWNQAMGAEI